MADLGSVGLARGRQFTSLTVVGGQLKLKTLDPSAAPISRRVRGYKRSTGALIAAAVSNLSGEATMFVSPFDKLAEFDIHALDDDAGSDLADVFFSRVVATAA